MNNKSQTFENNISLFELLKSIWDGKIKIILVTIILTLVGIGYNYSLPDKVNTFKYSLKINSSDNSEFIKFVPIYNFLNTAESDLTGIGLTGLKDPGSVRSFSPKNQKLLNEKMVDKFIQELMDFEELILALKSDETITKKISELSIKDQEKILFNYAKSFSIDVPNEDSIKVLNFLWKGQQDIVPGIIEKTLSLTLNNLIVSFYKELDDLLNIKINAVVNQDKRKVAYLLEQSAIAKKLNISDNQVDIINLAQSNVSFNMNTIDAYYLRGFKAIDMEIRLIEGRKYEFFQYLEEELSKIKKQKTKWIDYNIYLLEKKLMADQVENSPISLKILVVLGLILGILYTLILNVIKSRNFSRK